MQTFEVDALIRTLDMSYVSELSYKDKVLIALYDDNYDQKRSITLDDELHYVSSDALSVYGIHCRTAISSFVNRKYILFIDNVSVFNDQDTLKAFYDTYCNDYLPINVIPDVYAFKFSINNYKDYIKYSDMLRTIDINICPLYTFPSLVESNASNLALSYVDSLFGDQYEIFQFNFSTLDQLLSFVKSSRVKEEEYKKSLINNIEALVFTLNSSDKKPLIHVSHKSSQVTDRNNFALILAYINYRWKIPIYCDVGLQNDIIQRLNSFYFPIDICTLYDTVCMLKDYLQVGLIRKEFCEYMIYIPDYDRQIIGRISYLNENKEIVSVSLDLMKLECADKYDDPEFYSSLLELEKAMNYKVFLHVGNTLYIDLPTIGWTTVYVSTYDADFLGFVVPLNKELSNPYSDRVNLSIIRQILPLSGCLFKGIDGEEDMFSLFKKRLDLLVRNKAVKRPDRVKVIPYVPKLFTDGEAVLHYYYYLSLKDKYLFTSDSDRILNLCSYQNVTFRDSLINKLLTHIPLEKLRRLDYLTVYGTNFAKLVITEDLFKK